MSSNKLKNSAMASKKGTRANDDDVQMIEKPSDGSPLKINYELYNEEFGIGSSGKYYSNHCSRGRGFD